MTDITGGVIGATDISLGSVFERTFSILGRNFVPLMFLGGIAALPYLLIYSIQGDMMAVSASGKPHISPTDLGLYGASFLASFALRPICQAMILFGAFEDMRGRQFPVGESLRRGLSRFFPIIGMLIVQGLGVSLGFLLLVFPAFMLFAAWYVALPTVVVERLGPIKSLRRSAALTKGHRWKIFGIVFVVGLGAGAMGGIVSAIALGSHSKVLSVGLQYIFQAIVVAFQSVLGVVIYRDLRASLEGLDTDRIAAVFE